MAQTLVALLVHVVFSTKNRANLIAPELETELYSYVGGILKGRGSRFNCCGRHVESRSFADLALEERSLTRDDAGAQEKHIEVDQDAG